MVRSSPATGACRASNTKHRDSRSVSYTHLDVYKRQLLLGLYTDDGRLNSVGVIGAFPLARRKELFSELQPLVTTFDDHPWAWAAPEASSQPDVAQDTPDNRDQSFPRTPTAAAHSRWNAKKDLSFVPLSPELVVEVRYEPVSYTHLDVYKRQPA